MREGGGVTGQTVVPTLNGHHASPNPPRERIAALSVHFACRAIIDDGALPNCSCEGKKEEKETIIATLPMHDAPKNAILLGEQRHRETHISLCLLWLFRSG